MPGPLEGLRVIDCSSGTPGTRATGLLADYGADVVWVEPPGGDPFRRHFAIAYSAYNRGKRSIELDLHKQTDRDALYGLLKGTDVFVESWRPGVAERLGVGYAEVHSREPAGVYCSISGFGTEGPHRDTKGYEAIVQSVVGTMGERQGVRPIYEALPFASIGASYLAVIGILAALYRRVDDGIGRHVETSLMDGALAFLSLMWGTTDAASGPVRREFGSTRLLASAFPCGDGEYLGIHTGAVGGFARFITALGLEDRVDITKSGWDSPLTPEEKRVMTEEVPRILLSQDRATWIDRLVAADICVVPHLRPCASFDEPQVRHNQMVVEVNDPVLGPVQQVAPPAKFSRTPGGVRGPAPMSGAHSQAILNQVGDSRTRFPIGDGARDVRPILDGLRVVDIGAYFAGPYTSRLLADLGAEVIKVETLAGDAMRGLPASFRAANAGKRGIAVDLKASEMKSLGRQLAQWADVIHHNMRPGAAERLGVGYEQVRAENPNIIYLHSPGWGSTGPISHLQTFASLMSGYTGIWFECAGNANPPLSPIGNEDPGNGLLGAVAVLMALIHRARTGEGQLVENPQLHAAMAHMTHVVRRVDGDVLGAGLLDAAQLGIGLLDRLYETLDGWLCLVAITNKDIDALGGAVGVDLLSDERFSTEDAREANALALQSLLGEISNKVQPRNGWAGFSPRA